MCGSDGVMRVEGEGNRRDGPTTHDTWPTACPSRSGHTAARNEINGCASKSHYLKHWHLLLTKVALAFFTPDNLVKCLHTSDMFLRAAERQCIMFHCITGWLSPLRQGSRRRRWLFALHFRLSDGYLHIRISDPKCDIHISRYRLTTLVTTE